MKDEQTVNAWATKDFLFIEIKKGKTLTEYKFPIRFMEELLNRMEAVHMAFHDLYSSARGFEKRSRTEPEADEEDYKEESPF